MLNERMKEFAESYLYLLDMVGSVSEDDRNKIITAMVALQSYYHYFGDARELLKGSD